jgi:hypothetical protein
MTESGDCQPSADLALIYERLDVLRAELKKIGAAYDAHQIGLGQLIIAAKPFWDEQEKIKDELHSACFGESRDRDRERREQVNDLFELPFGYQHSFRDYQLTAKITWFCTGRGTHDPLLVPFTQPHEVRGADRRTRQLLVLRDIHDGIRRLEAMLRKEVTGHPGPPTPPDEIVAGVPHREHVEMVCIECGRQLRLGGRQLTNAGRSGLTEIGISHGPGNQVNWRSIIRRTGKITRIR